MRRHKIFVRFAELRCRQQNQSGLDNLGMRHLGVDPDDLAVLELIADRMLLESAIDLSHPLIFHTTANV
jgi:hypothetical protein